MALAAAAGLHPVPTGIEHGTVTVVSDGRPFEVTTFRRDVETFGRHATVAFSTDLAEDAARRDFTMNALYAEPDGTLVDPLGGLADLRARRVRFVGDPGAADRRGLPAHPALLPHPRLVRRPRGRPRRRRPRRLRRAAGGARRPLARARRRRDRQAPRRSRPRPRGRARWRRPASSPACCPAPTRRRWRRSSTSRPTAGARAALAAPPRRARLARGLGRPPAPVARRRQGARGDRRGARRGRAGRRRRLAPRRRRRPRRGAGPRRQRSARRRRPASRPRSPAAPPRSSRCAPPTCRSPGRRSARRCAGSRRAGLASGLRLDAAALLREADG